MKDNKVKIISTVIIVIVIVAVLGVVISKNSGKDSDSKEQPVTIQQTEGVQNESQQGESQQEALSSSENVTSNNEKAQGKKSKKNKKDKKNETTNYWDGVQVYEETGSNEEMTNEKGEKITEAYPGENDGWSPIVSPDDLEK